MFYAYILESLSRPGTYYRGHTDNLIRRLEEHKIEPMKAKKLSPVHPGEILLHDFMEPLNLSQYALAKAIVVTPIRVSQIVRGQRGITADTALRLSRYFGTRPG